MSIQINPHKFLRLRSGEVRIGNSPRRPTASRQREIGHRRKRHSTNDSSTPRLAARRSINKQAKSQIAASGVPSHSDFREASLDQTQVAGSHIFSGGGKWMFRSKPIVDRKST